jgi:hypothetical protein
MNNQQVAHLWANQSRDGARGSNFYFDGRDLFSYGRHFMVGRIVMSPPDKDAPCILLNSGSYSVSTSKHQAYARNAIYGLWPSSRTFSVPDPSARPADNFASYKARISELVTQAAKRRSAVRATLDMQEAASLANEANRYAATFKLRGRLKVPVLDEKTAKRIRAAAARENAAKRRAVEKRDAARAIEDEGARTEWRNYQARVAPRLLDGSDMLRISRDGTNVETQRGAIVPIDSARAVLRWAFERRADGWASYEGSPPLMVGDFAVREVTADGVTVGCHLFLWPELEKLRAALGGD